MYMDIHIHKNKYTYIHVCICVHMKEFACGIINCFHYMSSQHTKRYCDDVRDISMPACTIAIILTWH